MYHSGSQAIRLDRLGRWHIALLLCLFVASFPVGYFGGLDAPTMYLSQSAEHTPALTDNSTVWGDTAGELSNMDRINEQFTLTAELSKTSPQLAALGLSNTLLVDSRLTGRDAGFEHSELISRDTGKKFTLHCPNGQIKCTPLTLLRVRSIEYAEYRATVTLSGLLEQERGPILFKYEYINGHFTIMALCIKYLFLFFNSILLYMFVRATRRAEKWDTMRKSVLWLMIGQIAFNDPMFVVRITVGGWPFTFLNLFGKATFFAILIIFSLTYMEVLLDQLKVIHSVVQADSAASLLPKLVVVGSLWMASVAGLVLVELNTAEDPMYKPVDFRGFLVYKLASLILLVVTLLWFGFMVLRTLGEIRDVSRAVHSVHGQDSQEFINLKARFYVFAFATVCLFIVIAASLVVWYVGAAPLPGNNTPEFLAFMCFVNAYSSVIVYCNIPSKWSALSNHDDDDDDDDDVDEDVLGR